MYFLSIKKFLGKNQNPNQPKSGSRLQKLLLNQQLSPNFHLRNQTLVNKSLLDNANFIALLFRVF